MDIRIKYVGIIYTYTVMSTITYRSINLKMYRKVWGTRRRVKSSRIISSIFCMMNRLEKYLKYKQHSQA